eukprot:COSAG01_NODE_5158_length_4445_cov_12.910953_7_plen_128_part_00
MRVPTNPAISTALPFNAAVEVLADGILASHKAHYSLNYSAKMGVTDATVRILNDRFHYFLPTLPSLFLFFYLPAEPVTLTHVAIGKRPVVRKGARHVRGETLHTRLYHITHDEIVSPHNSSLLQRKL